MMVLRIVLAHIVIGLSLLMLMLLLLVDAVSMLLLLVFLDIVDVCGMTIVLTWFGQPPKESYVSTESAKIADNVIIHVSFC